MQEQVREFQLAGKYPTRKTLFNIEEFEMDICVGQLQMKAVMYFANRVSWISEELQELSQALQDRDLVEIADALGDILYFVFGTAVSLGMDLEPIFDEIHRSNMQKFEPCFNTHSEEVHCTACNDTGLIGHYRQSDGKLMKPECWTAPDISNVLETMKEQVNTDGKKTT